MLGLPIPTAMLVASLLIAPISTSPIPDTLNDASIYPLPIDARTRCSHESVIRFSPPSEALNTTAPSSHPSPASPVYRPTNCPVLLAYIKDGQISRPELWEKRRTYYSRESGPGIWPTPRTFRSVDCIAQVDTVGPYAEDAATVEEVWLAVKTVVGQCVENGAGKYLGGEINIGETGRLVVRVSKATFRTTSDGVVVGSEVGDGAAAGGELPEGTATS